MKTLLRARAAASAVAPPYETALLLALTTAVSMAAPMRERLGGGGALPGGSADAADCEYDAAAAARFSSAVLPYALAADATLYTALVAA